MTEKSGITSQVIKFPKVKEISLIGILAAINIASRLALQFLPNIKPVTAIIILSVMLFGLAFGIKLTIVTTIVSDVFLGLGLWTVFQILAWVVVCLLTSLIMIPFRRKNRMPKLVPMAVFSAAMGFVFGFVVSFEQFCYGGLALFIPYYIAGLTFDCLHAGGNFAFYLICAPILMKVMEKEARKLSRNQSMLK